MKDKTVTPLERIDGYYWVRYNGDWIICDWFDGWAMLIGDGKSTRKMIDSDFEEIDEMPITRQNAKQEYERGRAHGFEQGLNENQFMP